MSTDFDFEMREALRLDAEKLEQITGDDHTPQFFDACKRCDGRGRGPSAPRGYGWWWDEVELNIGHRLAAAHASDSWDGPGWDERDEVECPICGGTGLVEILDAPNPPPSQEEEIVF